MNNINYHRYCDSISFSGYNKNTFLNKWYRNNVKKFNQRFKNEWDNYHNLAHIYYADEEAAGRYGFDIVGDKEYKDIEKHYSPMLKNIKILKSIIVLCILISFCGIQLKFLF